tara:strand:+ start:272 stop:970 length:699 start_codon:yes stop_codon:yes gene_type:complete
MVLIFKVIILGDPAVGKSCLMNNYLDKGFHDGDPPTIGVEFGSRTEDMMTMIRPEVLRIYREKFENKQYKIDSELKLHIWNSSGQERFHSIVTNYYRNTHGAIFVFDLTRRSTLENLKKWIEDYEKYGTKSLSEVGALLVGCKTDLEDLREVYDEDIRKIAEKYHLPYFTVSSKYDSDKITRVFHNIGNQMMEKFMDNPPRSALDLINLRVEREDYKFIDYNYNKKWCCNLL